MTARRLSAQDEAALDRPIWASLHSKHKSLARGGPLAFRYPPTIAPFAAVAELTPAAVSDLVKFAGEAPVALLSAGPLQPLAGLDVVVTMVVCQMVLAGDIPAMPDFTPATLGAADAPEMLELTALTKPGPFLAETWRLGRYIGIRDGNRLAAMAGERMRLDGFTEISAVCVHPDHRGKGYAQILVKNLMNSIAATGAVPFLHVLEDNAGAIALYERLGFATRTKRNFTVLRLSQPR